MGSLPAASIFYPPGALALRNALPEHRVTEARMNERRLLADWVRRKPTWVPDSVWVKVLAANGNLLQQADDLAGIGGYRGFVSGLDYAGLLDEVAGLYGVAKLGVLGQDVPEPGDSWDAMRNGNGYWEDARRAFDGQARRISLVSRASRDFGARQPDEPGRRAIDLADEAQAFLEGQALKLKTVVDGAARYEQSVLLARGGQQEFQKAGVRARQTLQRRMAEYRVSYDLSGIGQADGARNASRKQRLAALARRFRAIVRKSDQVDRELSKLTAKAGQVRAEARSRAVKVVSSLKEYADIAENRYGDISISRNGIGADPIEFYSAAGEKLMLEYKSLAEAMTEVESAAWRLPSPTTPDEAGSPRGDEGDGVAPQEEGRFDDILGIGEVTVVDETEELGALGDFGEDGGLYRFNPTHGERQPRGMRSSDDIVPRFLGRVGNLGSAHGGKRPAIYRVMVINGFNDFDDAMPQTLGDIVKADYPEYDWRGGLYEFNPTHGQMQPRGMGHRGPRGGLPRFFGSLFSGLPPPGDGEPKEPIPPEVKKEIIKGVSKGVGAKPSEAAQKKIDESIRENEKRLAEYRAAEAAENQRAADCNAKGGSLRFTGKVFPGPTQGYGKLPDILIHECLTGLTDAERRASCDKQGGVYDPATKNCSLAQTCPPGQHMVCNDKNENVCIMDGDLLPFGWKQNACPPRNGGGPGPGDGGAPGPFGSITLGTLGTLALTGAAIVVVTLVGAIAVPSLMSAVGSVIKVKKQWEASP